MTASFIKQLSLKKILHFMANICLNRDINVIDKKIKKIKKKQKKP